MEKEAIAKIVGIMFMSRTYAHLSHLAITGKGSYATHVALNGFYDAIVDLADDLAEAVQGKYGIMEITVPEVKGDLGNPAEALKSHVTMIDNLCKKCETDWIDNIVQEAQKCYYGTIYKLENLS